jgi:DeoR/GlpR family transcriptional regulator of sugar metabolism
VAIADLSARLGVSEMTVRRDLVQLEGDGLLRRTHGGAERAASSSYEPPFALRSRMNNDAKRAIAMNVAERIVDGQTIIVDGGTTGVAVAEAIVGRSLTVCALNMRVAELLSASPNTRVMIPGGLVRHGELSMVGPAAERTLGDHRFDTYVMTVSAVDASAGLTEWNLEDAAVKRAALAASRRCVVACDSTKFGQVAFARIAGLDAAELIVTDDGIDPVHRKSVAAGTTLHVAA